MELKGIAASPGIAIGKAFLYIKENILIDESTISEEEIPGEIDQFKAALKLTAEQLEEVMQTALAELGGDNAKIFEAHLEILEDPSFAEAVCKLINQQKNSKYAVKTAVAEFVSMFEQVDDEYMKARAFDIADVGDRVLRNLAGKPKKSLNELSEPGIVIAEDLVPSDTAGLDKAKVLAFATNIGSRVSHTAIIAKASGIPAVLGLNRVTDAVIDGQEVIVDGDAGLVIINPTSKQLEHYQQLKNDQEKIRCELQAYADLPAVTLDGKRVEIGANIGGAEEISFALKYGAEGVGLFRTEFLFMDRVSEPDEDEQFTEYKKAAAEMAGRPVIIRTLDIGGDKGLPYLGLQEEKNPFLGYRAIRFCLDRPQLFKTQLRAILRASAYGNILIMYPMIGNITELRAANALLKTCMAELDAASMPYNKKIKVGIMVEVPAAAIMADVFAREVDFFSIGTNDLIQYTFAVDRMNQSVSSLYQPLNPAVLRLIKQVIDAGHEQEIFTGMCGEAAGDETAALVLLGLGLDEFSMNPLSIPRIKKLIRSITMENAREIANRALEMTTAEEVEAYLRQVLGNIRI